MKIRSTGVALMMALTVCAGGAAHAGTVFSGTTGPLQRGLPSVLTGALTQGSLTGGEVTLMNSAGFVSGSQIFSDAITVGSPGTLTVKLAGVPWLDALQNLNCFVTAPGGGIIGNSTNGGLDTVQLQAGTVYVNWYAQAGGPLSLGAYSLSVDFQPAAPPVPLPPTLLLTLSGLVALALVLRRPRLSR